MILSSPANTASRPPFRKKVTCGYFSVSAMRSWVRPALATTSPRVSARSCGGKIVVMRAASALEYSTIPAAIASAGTRGRAKPSKSGSSRAARISRARSAPEVRHHDAVAVADRRAVADHRRAQELVGLAAGVGGLDRRHGIVGAVPGLGEGHRPPGRLNPLPAVVAVHCEEPAGDGGDPGGAVEVLNERRQLASGALRRAVAAVGEGVHDHRHAARRDGSGERGDVALVAVHSAGRHQPHQVAGAAAGRQRRGDAVDRRPALELALGDRLVDARQVLEHHAAGTEVHVADFGVAHLALRQADMLFGGVHQPARPTRAQAVEHRCVGERDRVVLGGVALAPAVHDAEQRPGGVSVGSRSSWSGLYRRAAGASSPCTVPARTVTGCGRAAGRRPARPPRRARTPPG